MRTPKLNKDLHDRVGDDIMLYALSVLHGLKTRFNSRFTFRANKELFDIKKGEVKFKENVYEDELEDTSDFSWVREECKKITRANNQRKADYKACEKRIKKLFMQYKWLTKDMVSEAFDWYIRNTDPKYLRTPQRFILDIRGESPLMSIIVDIKENTMRFNEETL